MKPLGTFRTILVLALLATSSRAAGTATPQAEAVQNVGGAARSALATTAQLAQFGITWTFDREVTYGQFANGDYWVTGPVTITSIAPPSTEINGRTMNGSMVNPSPTSGVQQGYDSAMYASYGPAYDPNLNAALNVTATHPLRLNADSSLVSTISITETGARPQLKTAAILTVLDAAPPEGSFRPPYSGNDKTIRFNKSDLDYGKLTALSPVTSTPSLATVERYFERPWIDHVPNWMGGYHHPADNMPHYGREMAAQVGSGALMLHLNFTPQQKETLLIRYVQLGLDLYGVVINGGDENWPPNGGHASGRKWPILFAGIVLGDQAMMNIGSGDGSGDVWFGEDGQTFYVSQQDIDRTHDPDLRGCYLLEYAPGDLGLPEWGIVHATFPTEDNKAWCAIYRQCCTANAWAGFVLAAHIMNVKALWAHDALFDYQDRYMATEPKGTWTRSWDRFTEEMWDAYRANYGPVWPNAALELGGTPGDHKIYLAWDVNTTLPITSTWQIDYYSRTVASTVSFTGITNTTRAYTLTGLTNYAWYTVTLDAMLGSTSIMSDTVRVMPTDIFSRLPLVLKGN